MGDFDIDIQPKKEEESTLNYQLIVGVILAILLIGGGIYWFVNRGDDEQDEEEIIAEEDQETPETSDKVIDSTAFDQQDATLNTANDSINTNTDIQSDENTDQPEQVDNNTQETEQVKSNTENEAVSTTDLKYFIVKGAFKNENNAQKTLEQLKNDGYSAIIVGPTTSGLYIVSYEGFKTIEAAKSKLQEIRQSNLQAWIYKKQN